MSGLTNYCLGVWYFRHGIIHYRTTIQAFEMIEFPMRGIRSTAEHRDATDWAPFYRRWGGLFMVKLRQRVALRRSLGRGQLSLRENGHMFVGAFICRFWSAHH